MRPLYIFDLDGTLALIDHRRHLAEANRWDEFYRACVNDLPNEPIIRLFVYVGAFNGDRLIFSGRSDLVKQETHDWIQKNIGCSSIYLRRMLKMRKHGDNTPDEVLKSQWYDELSAEDKARLVCVFDDRQKVVDMWRSKGITCLQVAHGDF